MGAEFLRQLAVVDLTAQDDARDAVLACLNGFGYYEALGILEDAKQEIVHAAYAPED